MTRYKDKYILIKGKKRTYLFTPEEWNNAVKRVEDGIGGIIIPEEQVI